MMSIAEQITGWHSWDRVSPFAYNHIAVGNAILAAEAPETEDQRDIIREGGAAVHPLQNAMSGYAFAASVLQARGVLRAANSTGGLSVYELTPAGREAQERIRKEDLAAIGVYEG